MSARRRSIFRDACVFSIVWIVVIPSLITAADWRTQGGDPGLTKYSPDNVSAVAAPHLVYKKRFYTAWSGVHGNYFYGNNLAISNGQAILFADDAPPPVSYGLGEFWVTRFNWADGQTLAKYHQPYFQDEHPREIDSHHYTNPVIWHTDGRIYSRRGGDGSRVYTLDPISGTWQQIDLPGAGIDVNAFLQIYGDRSIYNKSGYAAGPYFSFDISPTAFAAGTQGTFMGSMGPWAGTTPVFGGQALYGDIPKVGRNISVLAALDYSSTAGADVIVMAAVDARDGTVMWQKTVPSDTGGLHGFYTSVSDYWRFLATEDGHFAFFTRLGTPTIHVLDLMTGIEKWSKPLSDINERPLLAYHAGALYVVGRSQQFKLNADTGAVLWQRTNSFAGDRGYIHKNYEGVGNWVTTDPLYRPVVLTDETLWFVDGDYTTTGAVLVGLKTVDGTVAQSIDLKALTRNGTESFGLVQDLVAAEGKLGILVQILDSADPYSQGGDYAYQDLYVYSFTTSTQPPTITAQPSIQTVNEGQTATFTVVVSGTSPLFYQWKKDGANIPGATTTSYTTPPTTASDNGSLFSVTVTNSAGSVTSNGATLVVHPAAPPPPSNSDIIWVQDSAPAGAALAADGGDSWNWINSNPAPYAGSLATQSNLSSSEHQHYFKGATATLAVNTGDTLIAYVYLDPGNAPSEVMLQWNDGSWDHRAYWGANQISWGTDGTVSRHNMGALPVTGQWVRLSVPASVVGLEGSTLNGMAFTLYGGRAAWDNAGKTGAAAPPSSSDVVWVEDSPPAGSVLWADGGDSWTWVNSNPTSYSGSLASQSNIFGAEHQHYFLGATATLAVNTGDTLIAYVYLDPGNAPSEVMLQWNDGTWDHRAYWGANQILWGIDGTASRRFMGVLPPAGQWAKLSVPAGMVGLEGRSLSGMAFTLYGGRASWDYAGKTGAAAPPPPASEIVWVEDSPPAGAVLRSEGGDSWNWTSTNPAPFSGSLASQSNIFGADHQHYFFGATATLAVNTGDTLIAYVYLDPGNAPSEVMLQWNDGTWDHRAYWGANQISWGIDGTAGRRFMGALPPSGQWVKLSVPASLVGLEGRTLNGLAFTLYGGRANWDRAGKTATSP